MLREVERVLAGEDHVLILGFEPPGLWARRHRLSLGGFPPGLHRSLSRRRLRDWLALLGFDVVQTTRLVQVPPLLPSGRVGVRWHAPHGPFRGALASST